MTCYDEWDAVVPCEPNFQTDLLLWACVGFAGLVLLFVALAILGQVHDWVADRYFGSDDDTPTPPILTTGPML